jgi:hypothetical protein
MRARLSGARSSLEAVEDQVTSSAGTTVRLSPARCGYHVVMDNDPTPPASDEADPEQQTTPGGKVEELEEMIEETDAEVAPPAD